MSKLLPYILGAIIVAAGIAAQAVWINVAQQNGPPDPGVAWCQHMAANPHDQDRNYGQLASSNNPDLRGAGRTMLRVAAMTQEDRRAAVGDIADAAAEVRAGCAALGVPLPAQDYTDQ